MGGKWRGFADEEQMLVPGAAEGLRTIIFIAVTKMNVLPLSLSTFPHLPPFTASPPPSPPCPSGPH